MATTLPEQASVEPLDQIADLLVDEEPKSEEPQKDVLKSVDDTQEVPDDTEVDESETEEQEETETEEASAESEEELTWGSVLGVDDSKVVLDDNEQLTGVKVKIDGEEAVVKMNDLIVGYQTNKHNTQKSQAIAQERKELETLVQQTAQEYKGKVEAVEKLTQYLKKKFTQDFENVDWQRLRHEDPAEYAAAMQDYNVRQAEIDRVLNAVDSEKAQLSDEEIQAKESRQKALVIEHAEKLVEKFPEWRDKKVADKAFSEMNDFVQETYGFTPEEFSMAVDSRLISMIHDALTYHKGKSLVSKKVNKVVPKFQKSTGRKAPKVSKLDKLTKRAKAAKGANKRDAQRDAVAELLTSGNR